MLEHVAFQNIDKIDAKRENKALMAKVNEILVDCSLHCI